MRNPYIGGQQSSPVVERRRRRRRHQRRLSSSTEPFHHRSRVPIPIIWGTGRRRYRHCGNIYERLRPRLKFRRKLSPHCRNPGGGLAGQLLDYGPARMPVTRQRGNASHNPAIGSDRRVGSLSPIRARSEPASTPLGAANETAAMRPANGRAPSALGIATATPARSDSVLACRRGPSLAFRRNS